MARIKKYADNLTQPLTIYQTFVLDSNPNSQYFRITEFKESFTGGKNGFLIEGSEYLKESTDIKIEILDVDGNPIYFEPGNGVPEYYEGLSKVIAVYIYEDTPIGNAKITILGELKTYIDTDGIVQPIPDEWAGIYNVKWEREFKVNRLLSNEDKVRFYRRPEVSITEIVKPIFSNVVAPKTQSGIINGIAQNPVAGTLLSNYTSPTTYLLETVGNSFWTSSMVGTYLDTNLLVRDFSQGSAGPFIPYRPLVTQIVNSREVLIQPPYYSENGLVANIESQPYTATFNYTEGVDNLKTALTGSFAKITLSDLTTFVGDCARVKIFRKSTTDLSDFQFVQEIQLESNEILVDLASTTKNQENYGLFDNSNFKEYWLTSSNNLVTAFNQTFLFDSIKLNSTVGTQKFFTTKSLNINEGIEYTLNFNVRKEAVGNVNNYIEAYISGSRQTIINGSPSTLQVKQSIVNLNTQNALLQKQIITENIKAEQIDNARLYFDVSGNDWHISEVSLKASQETAFSPDEITFIQSVPRILPVETFVYRFEFYDINNNYIPVLVEETKTFNGGNLQTIRKGLVFNPRSLSFQFDSGSSPIPPTVVGFTVTKNLLTGSVTYTSQSFDFDGNELVYSDYTASFTGQRYPGLLSDITSDAPTMTVGNFTGSRLDKTVQLVKITGEVEGFTDTVIFTRVLDGFGGVNYLIRPYRGTQIRNSSTASLEVQAIRIDGVNDIELSSTTKPEKGWPDKQLHIISRSADGAEKFVNLAYASSSRYIYGLTTGSLGSGEINYNATFNRDSIDFRRTIYIMSSGSAASGPAYETSGSVVASIILEDLQDGLDSGVVTYNADSFTINPRTETIFKPAFGFATASFAKRGTAASEIAFVTASFQIYPSMSINKDWIPEYWLYYHTQSLDPTITVVAKDDNKNIIPSQIVSGNVRTTANQTKNLTLTFTYTEPWTSASVSLDKTFTIVPEGKQGDESIVFEVSPISITLGANSRGIVNDYTPSITDIKLKQGSRYLAFSASAGVLNNLDTHGTFHIATASIIEKEIKAGNVHFTSSFGVPYTASLIVSQSSNFTQLSGSIEYPLIIHPYYTSSIYTASVVVNYTKILEGAPPIQIVISPTSVALTADEVGFVTPVGYSAANTTIQIKEGADFLKLVTTESFANADARKGTYTINSIETRGGSIWNIRTGSLASSSLSGLTGTMTYNRFDYPYVSASALYTIQVYPYALGAGHLPTSSIFTRTQTFTKNVTPPKARSIDFKASSYTVNYDRNGRVSAASSQPIILSATAFNTTSSADRVFLTISDIAPDGSESGEVTFQGDSSTNPVTFTLPDVNYNDVGPDVIKTFKVKLTDGNPYVSPTLNPYRAEAQLTISGIKAGADAYKLVASNESTTITADLWTKQFAGTGMKITTFNGNQQLINANPLPLPNDPNDLDFNNDPIGVLGYSSASIFSKSAWIGLTGGTPPKFPSSNPASIGDIISWDAPATNTSGQIVYRVDFEGDSSSTNTLVRPLARQTQFVTQSIAVQFTPPAPYDVKLDNENSSAIYKVSGEFTTSNTGTGIRVYRGNTELTNKPSGFINATTDAYGVTGYPNQCRISIYSKSSHITLANGWLPGSYVTGVPARMPNIVSWTSPETNPNAEIVYQVECEYVSSSIMIRPESTIYKTQSLSLQYEGATGPGIVMRGEWNNATNYSGSVETQNKRRDAVIYGTNPTTYYAAISGSGPTTYNKSGTIVGAQSPTAGTDNAYWQFLGKEEFFVAAKIAIFEESFVKNTINIGNNSGSAFANIVLAGGRPDPYMAIGQYANIGYESPGVWLGIYSGSGETPSTYKPRFSLVNAAGSRYLKWDGTALEIAGNIRIKNIATANDGSKLGTFDNGDAHNAGSVGGWELASDAIYSGTKNLSGYNPGSGLTLAAAGSIHSKNFYIDTSGNAFFKGNLSGASGTFRDTVTVGTGTVAISMTADANGTGSLTGPNFSLSSTGLTVSNATIYGRIEATAGSIGSWTVDNNILRDGNSRIFLDPGLPGIAIKEAGTTRLKVNYGELTNLASAGTSISGTGNSISSYTSPVASIGVNINLESDGVNFDLVAGTYTDSNVLWPGAGGIDAFNRDGNLELSWGYRIYQGATLGTDFSGTLVSEVTIGSATWQGGADDSYANIYGYTGNFVFTAPNVNSTTYTLKLFYIVQGYTYNASGGGSSQLDINIYASHPTIDIAANVNVVELTNTGIQIASSPNRYIRLRRDDAVSTPILDGKGFISLIGDTTNTLLQLSGTTTGTAINIEVGTGKIAMNNNNIEMGTGVISWNPGANSGAITTHTVGSTPRPTVQMVNIPGSGDLGGTIRDMEFSLSQWKLGRNTSARRYKEEIINWEHPSLLEAVNNTPIRTFYWKVDAEKEHRPQQIGVIAEELESAGLEEFVDYDWFDDPDNVDGPKKWMTSGIAKGELVFVLWKAVQELTQKVRDLESKIGS